MARDGSGNFSLAAAAFANGSVADADAVNTDLSDIASGLTQSLSKDGQTVPTANQPMGSFKHTGVADGSSRTDYASLGQTAKGTLFYAADTGAADAYVIAPSPGIAANVVGFKARWKVANANLTTTPTLATNSLTAGTIVWPDGSALAAGDLPANAIVETIIASLSSTTPTWHLQTVANFTGTGKLVKSTSPTLVAPALGTPASGVLSSCTTATKAQASNDTSPASNAYADRIGVQQVVATQTGAASTGTTLIPLDDTIPQNTEGDEYMSLAITPKSATSKLVIDVVVYGSTNVGSDMIVALFQDTTANALAVEDSYIDSAGARMTVSLRHVMTSGTTSATTFKVRVGGSNAGTFTFNGTASARLFGGAAASSITITEIGF